MRNRMKKSESLKRTTKIICKALLAFQQHRVNPSRTESSVLRTNYLEFDRFVPNAGTALSKGLRGSVGQETYFWTKLSTFFVAGTRLIMICLFFVEPVGLVIGLTLLGLRFRFGDTLIGT